jgi:hypothetical protein
MTKCWDAIPDARPKFGDLKVEINAVLEKLQTQTSKCSNLEYEKVNIFLCLILTNKNILAEATYM